jgi:hypothetical protein
MAQNENRVEAPRQDAPVSKKFADSGRKESGFGRG